MPGFQSFALLKGTEAADHVLYASHTDLGVARRLRGLDPVGALPQGACATQCSEGYVPRPPGPGAVRGRPVTSCREGRRGILRRMRRFNTEGPVRPEMHYCIPPLERLDVDRVLGLVRDERYFVLHAPRQTGKTSALLQLRDRLNAGAAGDLRCVYVNVEPAQAMREDVAAAVRDIVGNLASRARGLGDGFLYEAWTDIAGAFGAGALRESLVRWSEDSSKPLVLLIDEIDALVGDTLVSVLRQLRSGYDERPRPLSAERCAVRRARRS